MLSAKQQEAWESLPEWKKSLLGCHFLLGMLERETFHLHRRSDKFEGFADRLNTLPSHKENSDAHR